MYRVKVAFKAITSSRIHGTLDEMGCLVLVDHKDRRESKE